MESAAEPKTIDELSYRQSDGVSNSMLSLVAESGAKAFYSSKFPAPKPTEAQIFGSLFHCMLLEPKKVTERYVVMPKFDARYKDQKAAKLALMSEAENTSRITVVEPDFDTATRMCEAIYMHPLLGSILESSINECPMYWTDPGSQIFCKGKIDAMSRSHSMILDFKTTESASPKSFQKDIFEFEYHRQCAFYLDGANECWGNVQYVTLVCVQKTAPYTVMIHHPDKAALESGRQRYKDLLNRWKCEVLNHGWSQIVTAALPDNFTYRS